jgi:DNA-binding GntR family transcriptional regulator
MPGGETAKKWTSAYRDLRHDIKAGIYAPGAELPTIAALAKSAGLTNHGARRAMERLCLEGYAQSWQGRGFCVAMPRLQYRLGVRKPAFAEHARAQGFQSASELLAGKPQRLPRQLAERMQCRAGTDVLWTETLRKINGRAVALSIDYFRKDRLDGIVETIADTGSVSQALAMHGVENYRRDRTSFETRLPSAHEALVLGIPRMQPVYATLGANIADDGTIVQVSQGIWRGDCVVYEA